MALEPGQPHELARQQREVNRRGTRRQPQRLGAQHDVAADALPGRDGLHARGQMVLAGHVAYQLLGARLRAL